MKRGLNMAVGLYGLMCLIFGTTFLFIKTGLGLGWSPFLFSSLRFIFAGAILLTFVFFRKKGGLTRRQHLQIAGISLFLNTIPFGALYYSEQYISSGEAAILVSISPIFILLLHFLLKRNKVLLREVFGAMVCVFGIIILVMKDITYSPQFHSVLAKILMIASEMAFAFGTIQSKAILEKMGDSIKFNALQMLYGGLGLLIWALISKERLTVPANLPGYLVLCYFVIIASIVANGIFFFLVKKTNAFFPSTWTYVSPVIAMILGEFVLKEQLSVNSIIGAILVLIGVLLANSQIITYVFKRTGKEDGAVKSLIE